jgi:hypothetical protein
MVGPWPHPPGTLRALLTILKGPFHIICRPCRRYAPMEVDREDLDRPYEPCPFVCRQCGVRAKIERHVPTGFTLTSIAPKAQKPKAPEEPPPPLGPWHTPSF